MCDGHRHPSSRPEFRTALIALVSHGLVSRRRLAGPISVDGDTPLFETGLVDSMAILELVAFVEEATGRTISARQVHLKNFGTIDRICDAFWSETAPALTGGPPSGRV
jgi:acyl carrier protein